MQFWETYDMDVKLLKRCTNCDCSDILYGKHEKNSIIKLCHDFMAMNNRERKAKTKVNDVKSKYGENEIWQNKIKPKSPEFPK